jgi:hypothetical protein
MADRRCRGEHSTFGTGIVSSIGEYSGLPSNWIAFDHGERRGLLLEHGLPHLGPHMRTFDPGVPRDARGASTRALSGRPCLPASLCLSALAPSEKCRDSPRNPRGTITMSMIGVHPTFPGDMHGHVRVRLGVGLAGEALRLLHVLSMPQADQGRSRSAGEVRSRPRIQRLISGPKGRGRLHFPADLVWGDLHRVRQEPHRGPPARRADP